MVSFLFFASGFAGLIYQVAWAKRLALILGGAAGAQSFILAAFLGGLALGNALLGAAADRARSPLRLYAYLELAIAALGLLSPAALAALGAAAPPPWAAFLGAAAVVLPPAALMGGTLPALARWAAPRLAELRRGLSWLYFLNSAGAAAGAAAAGFLLLPALGLELPVYLAAALNCAIGAAALGLARAEPAPRADAAAAEESPGGAPAGLLLGCAFASGLAALGYEIAWIRLLALGLGSSAYAFSLMVAGVISGIALGSLAVARGPLEREDPARLFGLAQLGAGLAALAALPAFGVLPFAAMKLATLLRAGGAGFGTLSAVQFLLCFALTAAPTFFLGAALPLAARAAASAGRVGASVGKVYALNTLGNVLGAFAAGLWLLPALGAQGLVRAGAALNLLAGSAVLWRLGPALPRRRLALGLAAAYAALCALGERVDPRILASGAFRRVAPAGLGWTEFRAAHARDLLLFHRDDREATVTVTQTPAGERFLKVNGKTDASTGGDLRTQALLAHLPLALHPAPRAALIIGLGSGATAGSALAHPLRSLDSVELSAAVVAAEPLFRDFNGDPLGDPRHRLHLADARAWLARGAERYDVIISEPSNPWIAGVGNLFTAEFYRVARERLRPGGLMAQWFHLYEMDDGVLQLALRTFRRSFPHATVWMLSPDDILLLGSTAPLPDGLARVERAFARPAVREDLGRAGIADAASLLSLQCADDRTAWELAGRGRLNEDLFPLLEYRAPRALALDSRARLLYARDARRRGGGKLYLARWVAERGRGLSREEYARLAALHSGYLRALFVRDWARSHPDDPAARAALARLEQR